MSQTWDVNTLYYMCTKIYFVAPLMDYNVLNRDTEVARSVITMTFVLRNFKNANQDKIQTDKHSRYNSCRSDTDGSHLCHQFRGQTFL